MSSDKKYPVVYLDEETLGEARELAHSRDDPKEGKGYLDEDQNSLNEHLRGVLGEIAVAQWLDIEDELDRDSYGDSGDDGVDLTVGGDYYHSGFDIDVKTTRYDDTGRLLVQEHHVERALDEESGKTLPDLYILCEVIEQGVVGIVGCIRMDDLLDREPRTWPRDHSNYVVEREELSEMPECRGDARTEPVEFDVDEAFDRASAV